MEEPLKIGNIIQVLNNAVHVRYPRGLDVQTWLRQIPFRNGTNRQVKYEVEFETVSSIQTAVLPWGEITESFKVSDKEIALANLYGREEVIQLFVDSFQIAAQRLVETLSFRAFTGEGSLSQDGLLVGLIPALLRSEYAGISRKKIPQWASSNMICSSDKKIAQTERELERRIYTASGITKFQQINCRSAFEYTVYVGEGCVDIVQLPASSDKNKIQLWPGGLDVYLNPLAMCGDNFKIQLISYPQLRVLRPNGCGVLRRDYLCAGLNS